MSNNPSWHTVSFMCKLTEVLKPKENMTISEWADKYMVLPEGSNEAGRFSSDTLPYQKAIMDAITDPEVVDVSVMSSAQVGKTTMILCGIAYYIDHEPATQMMVLPTIDMAEKFSKTRLATMIRDIPRLTDEVAPVKSRNSGNTILMKSYPGGDIILAGANSAASLSSQPRRIVWMDETDRFPESAGSEGNPIKLAEKRSTSYWNKKHIKTSTPTISGKSKIEDAYNKGSMEEWCVACPECGEYQPYDFKRVIFDSVSMSCCKCGCISTERQWKDSNHKWIANHPERRKAKSFKLNELASPFVDWFDIINDFKDANEKLKKYHDAEDLKVFVNTVLGETWDEVEYEAENTVDLNELEKRAESYEADIPDGVLILTAAVDVQDNRFEIEIRGWGRDYESWGIYKTEIYGNLITDEPWIRLEEYLNQTFIFADGTALNIAGFAIDTGGHFTNKVYKWSKYMKAKGKKCYAIKGYAAKPDIPLIYKRTLVDIKEDRKGKAVVVDRTVIHIIGVDAGKDDITNRLAITEPGAGYCHFPSNPDRGYDKNYYDGLTCEHKIDKKVNGIIKKMWVKKSGARNEPFDLFNYNYATLELIRPDFDVLEKKINSGINYMVATPKTNSRRKSKNGLEV